eukprot:s143_g41.t1
MAVHMSDAGCLVGHICQLNYGWGGLVEHQTLGASQRLPFSGSTWPLRIGQEVGFRLRHVAGKVQAVDLCTPLRSQHSLQAKGLLGHARLLQSQDGLPVSKLTSAILQRQVRRLQRGILKFNNATKLEQYQQVLEAERILDDLLGQPDVDGDSLCQLVRRCSSWLHAPIFKAMAGADEEASLSDEQQDHMNLQCRVRQLLIRALNHLDLSDRPTFEAVEAALRYMALFVQRLEEIRRSSKPLHPHAAAMRQWQRLHRLLPASLTMPENGAATEVKPMEGTAASNESNPRRIEGYKKSFAGKVYEPSVKTRKLSTVSQDHGRPPVKLQCSECAYTVTSNWYFQHPKTGIRSVVTPRDGHNVCQQKLKKRCYWQSLDGCHAMAGISSNMEFCKQHQRLLTQCAPCGGKKMCIHGRQKYHCKKCRGNGFCTHGRRKFKCPTCQGLAVEKVS